MTTPTPTPAALAQLSLRWVVAYLYPRRCNACRTRMGEDGFGADGGDGADLCASCRDLTPTVEPPVCDRCGEPFAGSMEGPFTCSNCNGIDLAFDFAVAPYRLEGPVRDLIHRFKFGRRLYLRQTLGLLTAPTVLGHPRIASELTAPALVPIPLHPTRQRNRGFNQAEEIARQIARRPGAPKVEDILVRLRPTPPQARLARRQRLENLRGAFGLAGTGVFGKGDPPNIAGRDFILIDDVLTTGSSVSEAARALKEAGAKKVAAVTVARG